MALANKCVRNFPPLLSYVTTLPDITQKQKRDIDELKHRHLGPYSSGHHRQSIDHWQTRLCACVKAKGCHFEHLLWSRHTTSLEADRNHYISFGRSRNPAVIEK